jgi:hypothetical protein
LSAAAPRASLPFRLELIPSRALAAAIALVHLAAAGSLLTVLAAWPGIVLATLVLMLGGIAARDRALLRAPGSPRWIELHPDGRAKCLFANGESADLPREKALAVTQYWVALRLQARRRRSLFVTAGMLAPEDLRRLRLWVLWGRLPGLASGQAPQRRL